MERAFFLNESVHLIEPDEFSLKQTDLLGKLKFFQVFLKFLLFRGSCIFIRLGSYNLLISYVRDSQGK